MPDLMGPHTDIRAEFGVPARMRDGITLYADLYRPAGNALRPVLLQRTPYDKSQSRAGNLDVLGAASHGYAVIIQDARGRYAAEGEIYPFLNEPDDGYDTVQWCGEIRPASLGGAVASVAAAQTIHHSAQYPSRLRLPVIPG